MLLCPTRHPTPAPIQTRIPIPTPTPTPRAAATTMAHERRDPCTAAERHSARTRPGLTASKQKSNENRHCQSIAMLHRQHPCDCICLTLKALSAVSLPVVVISRHLLAAEIAHDLLAHVCAAGIMRLEVGADFADGASPLAASRAQGAVRHQLAHQLLHKPVGLQTTWVERSLREGKKSSRRGEHERVLRAALRDATRMREKCVSEISLTWQMGHSLRGRPSMQLLQKR